MTLKRISVPELQAGIEAVLERVVGFREDLHRHPELSWQEYRTTLKIKELLAEYGIKDFSMPLPTGVIAEMVFTPGAPFVLLRADIDALPLQDEKETPYRSQNAGVCHACGHDAHTAVMAGVALALKTSGAILPFNLRFVFQPAEEPIPSGAPRMIEAGVLERVRYALGLHMEPRLPLGSIALTPGWINMQSVRLDLVLEGPGGHSARPHETADLLWLASRIIQEGYEMVYRRINLLDSAVILTFTEIEAGRGYNVIPNKLSLTATLRISDPRKKDLFIRQFQDLLHYLEKESGARIRFEYREGAPAIHNDSELIHRLHRNIRENFWLPLEVQTDFRTPGGDDFSFYSEKVPGAMVRFGVRTDTMTANLHEGRFDVHPEAIRTAVAFFLHQLVHLEDEGRLENRG